MWAIMVIRKNKNGKSVWDTHSQWDDYDEATREARRVDGAVVPWDSRILLLDNGLLEKEIQIL
jgi:hypothetical protein